MSPSVPAPAGRETGTCGACRAEQVTVVAAESVVSVNFTDWDRIDRGNLVVCDGCAWAVGEPAARTHFAVASAQEYGSSGFLSADWLVARELLSAPLGVGQALSLPVGGRKHLLPFADWRFISTDWGLIRWGAPEVELLRAVMLLRAAGWSEAAIRAAEMPSSGVTAGAIAGALPSWVLLRRWRGSPALQVSLRVSRPTAPASRGLGAEDG